MHIPRLPLLSLSTLLAVPALTWAKYDVKPFKIHIPDSQLKHAKQLTELTRLPGPGEFASSGNWSLGIPLAALESLRDEWLTSYDWRAEEAKLNSFAQYTVEIDGMDVHFLHEKSGKKGAIPLVMFHGWPGSFHEYLPTVRALTDAKQNVSFDVVIPTLPGFTFSSPAPLDWNNADTGRLMDTLMTGVLGYSRYMVFGSDWGADVAWSMYSSYPARVRAAQFAFIPFLPPTRADLANVTLTPFQQTALALTEDWTVNNAGYITEQAHKPNTIGLALLDNPLGTLTWLAQLFKDWSDPTPAGQLTRTDVLTAVSLYAHTRTLLSSAWIYSRNGFRPYPARVDFTDAPMGFGAFRWNIQYWPREYVARVGNLVVYNEHEDGGHFPGLDNPEAVVADLRQLAGYWKN